MKGTIRRNNVLEDTPPYGCHSMYTPDKYKFPVRHGAKPFTKVKWEHRMSTKCRYDRKHQDERCKGCKVEYDAEYVANLR